MDISLDFQEPISNFSLELETDDHEFDLTMEDSTHVLNDHRLLSHRESEDQHPIEAITGLSRNLSSIENTSSRLTQDKLDISSLDEFSNLEIKSLWDILIH